METFVLRIWAPATPAGDSDVPLERHGVAQHVTTGRSGIFRSDAQLLRLLGELPRTSDDRGVGDERNEANQTMPKKEPTS